MRSSRTALGNSFPEPFFDSTIGASVARPPLSRLGGFRNDSATDSLALSCISAGSTALSQSSPELSSRLSSLSADLSPKRGADNSLEHLGQLTAEKISSQTTALTARINPHQLTQISRQQLQLATSSDGTLSVGRHAQIRSKMDKEVDLALEQQKSKNKQIQDLTDSHISQISSVRQKLSLRFERLLDDQRTDEESKANQDWFVSLLQLSYSTLEYHDKNFKSGIAALHASNISEEAKSAIDLIICAREKEIQMFSSVLDIIRNHEMQHFQMEIQAYEIKMKEQEILFARYLQCREVQQQEVKYAEECNFRNRAQQHQEDVDREKLAIERQIVAFAHEVNQQREKNQLAIESLKIQTQGTVQLKGMEIQKAIQMRSIDVEETLGKQQIKGQMALAAQAIEADERKSQAQLQAQMVELHMQGQLEHHRISVDGQVKAIQARAQERVGIAQAAASASPCSIM
jgi:hypothetical protein